MQIGDKLSKFSLLDTDGEKYTNFDFADKYALLIIVTCNHCPYSRIYWNRLHELAKKYEEDNLAMVAINSNDASKYPADSYENMVKLAKEIKLPYLYLHDEKQTVAKKLGARKTPEAFLFNNNRELVYKGAIDDNWEHEKLVTRVHLEDALEYCLDGIDIDYPEIPAVGCSIKWKDGNEPE
jgi:peroxiredoxin